MKKCYVFIGPSGSGKNSIAEKIFRQDQKSSPLPLVNLERVNKIKKIIILFLQKSLSR